MPMDSFELTDYLQSHFGYRDFLPGQKEAVETVRAIEERSSFDPPVRARVSAISYQRC